MCKNFDISVIIEDIYLNLRIVVLLSNRKPIPVGEVILQFFLTKLCPFFNLEFSCKNFDIFKHLCYYWRYILETQNTCSCSLSKGEPIPVGKVILQFLGRSHALFNLEFSCKNFDSFYYLCYYWRYLLETQNSCSLSKGEPIQVGEIILHFLKKVLPLFWLRMF